MHDDKQPLSLALRLSVIGLATYALFGGSITLIGWSAKVPRLTDWPASGISMFPNAALASVCSGAALLFGIVNARWSTRLLGLLGLAIGILGGATLLQHLTGLDFRI